MVTISSVNTCVHTCRETSPNCAGYLGGIHTVGPPAIAMCAAYVESYRMLKHPELCKVCIHGSCLCAGQASKLVVKVDASEHLELVGAALLPRRTSIWSALITASKPYVMIHLVEDVRASCRRVLMLRSRCTTTPDGARPPATKRPGESKRCLGPA